MLQKEVFPIRLFERVPASFFSVLASPNREIYWVALVTLHNMLQYSLEIPLEDYRTALGDELADMELAAETDGEESDQELLRQPNGKIRWIINRLIRSGWLDREYREGSFEEVIALRDYADRMIRLLLSIEKLEDREYNSLVYATYSSLKQAYVERSDHIYDALTSAKRNTQELLNDLKSLFHNIRFYHQSIGQALDVNQLLRDYYDDYKKLLDRIYHPIKTMDSLSIYRDPIIDILNGLQYDDELLEMAAKRMCDKRDDLTPEAANDALLADINFLLASYGSLDGLVGEMTASIEPIPANPSTASDTGCLLITASKANWSACSTHTQMHRPATSRRTVCRSCKGAFSVKTKPISIRPPFGIRPYVPGARTCPRCRLRIFFPKLNRVCSPGYKTIFRTNIPLPVRDPISCRPWETGLSLQATNWSSMPTRTSFYC